ncbi:AraC family transcriptional regulator [Ammoniphilus sp. CFH 90114]|uniref:helix-turn-helix domain-containing protein n=1 Tax=Ammoniphilus sp. CFH 90114 TaxID=2493665 RepID=UPI00100DD234|nr:AraC family transcriptional regulator [Ammoniphilus sp. CFH 90114]RXT07790.1 AraC family transcriptional regulator [Ammoniphilus sp. CFH 90114]
MRSQQVENAIRFIEDHLTNPIAVEEVTKQVNFSYYHFHRLFKALTGETLGGYIRKRRLTEAAIHLLHTNHSIISIKKYRRRIPN